MCLAQGHNTVGPRVIKLDYSLKLKIKLNEWLLADTCVRKQPIIGLYFESENELKFYNLGARSEGDIKTEGEARTFQHLPRDLVKRQHLIAVIA